MSDEQELYYLIPLDGAEHKPNTVGGPWRYPINSEWRSIYKADGVTPRPILNYNEALHAEQFFTLNEPGKEPTPLARIERKTGRVELHEGVPAAAPASAPCPDCGQQVPLSELVAHLKAHIEAAGEQPARRGPGRPPNSERAPVAA